MGMLYEYDEFGKCVVCGSDKLKYPEGHYCPQCQADKVSQLAKKYADIELKKKI